MTRVTSHPPGTAAYFMLLLCPRPNSQTLKFHSPVSPDPNNARSLRSLGFRKSPPLKNPRSANVTDVRLQSITPSVCLCVQHDARYAGRLAGPSPQLRHTHSGLVVKVVGLTSSEGCLVEHESSVVKIITRSSAIAEGPRDASCQLKSCQLPRNSAETTCTTSPEPSLSCR